MCSIVPPAWLIYVEHDIQSQETEGKQYIRSLNNAQRAYHLETANFTDCFESLGLETESDTKNYSYIIAIGTPLGKNRYQFMLPDSPKKSCQIPKEKLTTPYPSHPSVVMHTAIPKNPKLKTYVGLAFEANTTYGTNSNAIVFVCENYTSSVLWVSKEPSVPPPSILLMPPKIVVDCSGNTVPISAPSSIISSPDGFQKVKPEVKQHLWFFGLRLPWV
ncbi:type IV pilin-like G/H family protein [Funiculus sociatus GB2-A5]|uniref:Type IV pilin-like G/H family protein n=1 Tax=Funiculus sociatus GB2-A5 TaxID=2933946 RepID=A0ABV0JUF4_9CYAN